MACIKKTSYFCVIFLVLFSQVQAWCTSSTFCAQSRGESCCDGKCSLNCPSCTSDRDCLLGGFCCGLDGAPNRQCARSCIGMLCISDRHCASGEYCDYEHKTCAGTRVEGDLCFSDGDCSNGHCCGSNDKQCLANCIGQPCNSYHDCSTGQCCDDDKICKTRNCDTERKRDWQLVVSIGAPIFLLVIFAMAWLYHVLRSSAATSRRPADEELTQLATTGAMDLASQQEQGNCNDMTL
ncbi:host cell factor 1-like isoform X5 [Paramuricea clavata]|uniref:Host cell factor 1-like isoform X5 n=1 Tax=Paramuricea clavata TaxID=317549 RepID=A0A7D9KZZ7_PARCT|nr:host cell factor 1-like isoform X5 [Paramuricea clavata]